MIIQVDFVFGKCTMLLLSVERAQVEGHKQRVVVVAVGHTRWVLVGHTRPKAGNHKGLLKVGNHMGCLREQRT